MTNQKDTVDKYRYFRDFLPYLKSEVQNVTDRDNLQAETLGLTPVEFVDLRLVIAPSDAYVLWSELVDQVKVVNIPLYHKDSNLYYACFGMRAEKYFEKNNRPDDRFGLFKGLEEKKCTAILMGYLQ